MTAANCASNWTSVAPSRSFQIDPIENSRSPSTTPLQAALPHRDGVQQVEGLQAHRNPLRQIGAKLSRLCLPRRRSCMVDLMSFSPSQHKNSFDSGRPFCRELSSSCAPISDKAARQRFFVEWRKEKIVKLNYYGRLVYFVDCTGAILSFNPLLPILLHYS